MVEPTRSSFSAQFAGKVSLDDYSSRASQFFTCRAHVVHLQVTLAQKGRPTMCAAKTADDNQSLSPTPGSRRWALNGFGDSQSSLALAFGSVTTLYRNRECNVCFEHYE